LDVKIMADSQRAFVGVREGKQLLAREAPHVRAEPSEAGLHLVGDEDAAGLAHHLHGHLGDRGTIAPEVIEAFGKRIRYFNTFGGNPASFAVAHAVLKVIKAGRRLVLISATGNEGQILKIRSPLVFSSKDAKLFLATLDEVLTALWRTPPAGLPVQARGRWDQGRLIEPTRSVSAPFVALSTTLSGENTAHGQWQRSFDCRVRCLLLPMVFADWSRTGRSARAPS
jgi:hypothetical protein